MSGRPCGVCLHPERDQIDRELVAGRPYRDVSARYEVSASGAFRHRNAHIPAAIARAETAREVAYGGGLIDELMTLLGRVARILDRAEADNDQKTALAAVRESRACLESLGRAVEAMDPPQIGDVQVQRLVSAIREVLPVYPDALHALSAKVAELGDHDVALAMEALLRPQLEGPD